MFGTDATKTHVTGFSRGGYVTWRLMCEHADRFASVAPGAAGSAPGGDCMGTDEVSCPFDASVPGGMPSRPVPVLFLIGRTDAPVPYSCAARLRDQAVAGWSLGAAQVLSGDDRQTLTRWAATQGSGLLETWEHDYQTVPDGPRVLVQVGGSPFDCAGLGSTDLMRMACKRPGLESP